MSYTDLIKRKIGDESTVQFYYPHIRSSIQQMQRLIEGVNNYTEVRKGTPQFELVDLNQIAYSAKKKVLENNPAGKSAAIEINQLPKIVADKNWLTTIFEHLFKNSLEFNNDDIPSVQLTYDETPHHHELQFKDNGLGIPEDYQDYVFEMFKRLNHRGLHNGPGLGLTICRRMVTKMGGTISIRNKEAQGTTITVKLPKKVERLDIHNIMSQK